MSIINTSLLCFFILVSNYCSAFYFYQTEAGWQLRSLDHNLVKTDNNILLYNEDSELILLIDKFVQNKSTKDLEFIPTVLTIDQSGCFSEYRITKKQQCYSASLKRQNNEITDIARDDFKTVRDTALHHQLMMGMLDGNSFIFTLTYLNKYDGECYLQAVVKDFVVLWNVEDITLPHHNLMSQLNYHQQLIPIFNYVDQCVTNFIQRITHQHPADVHGISLMMKQLGTPSSCQTLRGTGGAEFR